MVYESMPAATAKWIQYQEGDEASYKIVFKSYCNWSVNYGVNDRPINIDLTILSFTEIARKASEYTKSSLQIKSKSFHCEIMVRYYDEGMGFDQFDYYKDGNIISRRKIAYKRENVFDWDKLEYIGHEKEYDEKVTGEIEGILYAMQNSSFGK